jgi:Predicted endonuclease containing a URI domain
VWAHETQLVDDAFAIEKKIQGWTRAKRETLIEGRFEDLPALSRSAYRPRGLDTPPGAEGGYSARAPRDQSTTTSPGSSPMRAHNFDPGYRSGSAALGTPLPTCTW